MIRRPPRSTLFPTRRSSDLCCRGVSGIASDSWVKLSGRMRKAAAAALLLSALSARAVEIRSEEHTSELQSQSNLVCRLLLAKQQRAPDARRTAHASRSSVRL